MYNLQLSNDNSSLLLAWKLFFIVPAKRPPVEETTSFLQSLIASHGPNYLEKLFGSKARDALEPLGGVEKVAITLSGKYLCEVFCSVLFRWIVILVRIGLYKYMSGSKRK